MKRLLLSLVAGLVLMSAGALDATASPNDEQIQSEEGPCAGRWRTPKQVKQGIRCVWARFDPGAGGAAKALDVAWCESRYDPEAYGNGNAGLFQHNLRYWDGRFERFIEQNRLRRTWGLSDSAYSGRTNAIVTALMVRRGGWGPWSCG